MHNKKLAHLSGVSGVKHMEGAALDAAHGNVSPMDHNCHKTAYACQAVHQAHEAVEAAKRAWRRL